MLNNIFFDEQPIHLILDIYRAHITDKVKELANAQNIILHFIPAEMTYELQPLDRSIFGPLRR